MLMVILSVSIGDDEKMDSAKMPKLPNRNRSHQLSRKLKFCESTVERTMEWWKEEEESFSIQKRSSRNAVSWTPSVYYFHYKTTMEGRRSWDKWKAVALSYTKVSIFPISAGFFYDFFYLDGGAQIPLCMYVGSYWLSVCLSVCLCGYVCSERRCSEHY